MPTNRHAQIRYTILDRCFSNFNRLYDYEALLEEVNAVLQDMGAEGIKKRQLQYDIEHMQSREGWEIELDGGIKIGRKKGFRYKDKNYSIANHPLNVDDVEQLETTLAILSRYKHREEFSWLEELIPRMQQSFELVDKGEEGIISYQENIDLEGRGYIGTLFNLILKQKRIKLIYKPYDRPEQKHIVNPEHLKQYNNRWFLFCYNETYESFSNYALDRVKNIEETNEQFEPSPINWMDYFDDIIGVSKPEKETPVKIKLKFSKHRLKYVLTKPLHGTQKPDKSDKTGQSITIEVIPNPELYQTLLSFGSDVEVLSPPDIRTQMAEICNQMNEIYKYAD